MMKKQFFKLFWLFILIMACPCLQAEYQSQNGQDRFINELFFKGKRNGTFVDIGAYNGLVISNTYFFEKELGWTGICIEPLPKAYEQLKHNRSCVTLNCAIGAANGSINFVELDAKDFPELAMLSGNRIFFDDKQLTYLKGLIEKYNGTINIFPVNVRTVNDILSEYKFFNIDFLSIDIEGGELEVLSSVDFDKFKIHIMLVENNDREKNTSIKSFLESKGFRFVARLEQDELYENMMYSH